jgi:hypothetical protein
MSDNRHSVEIAEHRRHRWSKKNSDSGTNIGKGRVTGAI